jgi:hypothetical protein
MEAMLLERTSRVQTQGIGLWFIGSVFDGGAGRSRNRRHNEYWSV